MKRREFIKLLGNAAAVATWPVVPHAQQIDRVRLIGSLNILAEVDPESMLRSAAFKQALQELGWTEGGNVRIETAGRAAMTDWLRNMPRSWPR